MCVVSCFGGWCLVVGVLVFFCFVFLRVVFRLLLCVVGCCWLVVVLFVLCAMCRLWFVVCWFVIDVCSHVVPCSLFAVHC